VAPIWQVTGGRAAEPAERTVSVALSDKAGELELIDLPMLPSLASNSSISECYERVSGSDAAERPGVEAHPDTSAHRGRGGRLSDIYLNLMAHAVTFA
jgi:hypothetical protein